MNLQTLLRERKGLILGRWIEQTAAACPEPTARFLQEEEDPFANPVGYRMRRALAAVWAAMLVGAGPEAYLSALDEFLEVRSVSGSDPARALSFVFALKEVIARELVNELRDPQILAEWSRFSGHIDALALVCFERYVSQRERLFSIRVEEMKRRAPGVSRLGRGILPEWPTGRSE